MEQTIETLNKDIFDYETLIKERRRCRDVDNDMISYYMNEVDKKLRKIAMLQGKHRTMS
jgi:hypothetical protein